MALKSVDDGLSRLYGFGLRILPPLLRRVMPNWTLISFGLSSCLCLVIDKAVFTVICMPLQGLVGRAIAIAIAIVTARLVSGNCNYFYNQSVVFRRPATVKSYFQYWGLVTVNLSLAMMVTEVVSARIDAKGFNITIVNFCVDVTLFLISFTVQKFFIFRKRA